MGFQRFSVSRRTCFKWIAALVCRQAVAQQSPVAYQAASSDSSKVAVKVSTGNLLLGISEKGHVLRLSLGSQRTSVPARLCTVLAGCVEEGKSSYRELTSGGAEFTRHFLHPGSKNRCRVVETFTPLKSSIRWEIEILGESEPWSCPIETQLAWLDSGNARHWAAWGQPPDASRHWHDPLVLAPFTDRKLRYGGRLGDDGVRDEAAFSIPLVTVADIDRNVALTIVQSPEDVLLDMELQTTELGDVILRRLNHRITSRNAVRFSIDLVAHAADWRGGVGWMARRYPRFFVPQSVHVYDLDGCAAYSGYQGPLDVARLSQMGYSFNWNAHFDFPFLGMSLPPVQPGVEWKSWYEKATSISSIRDYEGNMKAKGFHVLEYFVLFECGNYIQEFAPPRKAIKDADLWQDPNDFVHYQIPDAVLRDDSGKIVFSNWFSNVVVDPADSAWRQSLLAQAAHMIQQLPDFEGVCIDRLDWMALYNGHRDDGLSWVNDKPVSAFVNSWKQAMSSLGPLLHDAGKSIYVNCLSRRIDTLEHVDGLYAELGTPSILNLTAVMGLQRPVTLWTYDINVLRPDPDAYFQSHLHMGVFLTVPYPEADHTIAPDPWVDEYYLMYGPLFNAMRGRRWVLEDNAVSCIGSTAKVNLFEIPGGFVLPITFGSGKSAELVSMLQLDPAITHLSVECLYPGEEQWVPLHTRVQVLGKDSISVALKRGCALLRMTYAKIELGSADSTDLVSVQIISQIPLASVHYTLDGTEPTVNATLYSKTLRVAAPALIKAAIILSGQVIGRTLVQQLYAV